jgi:lipopolysaccharide transport system ATP-binding protein
MSNTAIKVENLSKIYRLGEIGTGTISRDMERWFKTKVLKQEDPFLKIGETNDRANKGKSDIVYSLQDINFEINQGDAVGIIGRNGAGKSTLLKILSRVTTPTTGRINIKGRVASLLEVGTGFHPELTGRENIYLNGAILGMRKREIDRKLDEIIDFSGVERYIDTPVKRYSSGMYVRLAFAVAAHLESEILIVDEVLAVGDAEFQKKCLGKMGEVSKGEGRTVLFVSHNLDAVKVLCNRGLLLNSGKLEMTGFTNEVLKSYSENSKLIMRSTFSPKNSLISILELSIDNNSLKLNYLKVNIHYIQNSVITDIHPGIVIYNALNTPIFGSNSRYHQRIINSFKENIITFHVPKLLLHSGLYKVSVWLGDQLVDYDQIEHGLVFEYVANNNYISMPDPLTTGSVDLNCHWEYN